MEVNPKAWAEFRADLLAIYEPPLRSLATYRAMRHAFDQIEGLGAVDTTADLTAGMVAALIKSRPAGQSPRTLLKLLRYVRIVCNYAMVSGYLVVSPFAVRPVRAWVPRLGPPIDKRHFSREDIRSVLIKAAEEARDLRGWPQWKARRLQALAATLAYCGLRASEALNLHVDDVHLDRRCILLADRSRSGGYGLKTAGSALPVPMPTALVPILTEWLEHRLDAPPGFEIPAAVPWLFPNLTRTNPWRSGAPGTKPIDCIKALGRRSGVEGLTLQSLRRSLATHLEHHGAGQAMITRILRHTNPETTQKWYQKADVANMVDQVSTLDFLA